MTSASLRLVLGAGRERVGGYLATRASASRTTSGAGLTGYVSASDRHFTRPSVPTMKMDGHAIPFSASSTP